MKQITFRQLQTNTEWLKDLPVEITRYGKVVAKVVDSDGVVNWEKGKGDPIKELEKAAKEHLFDHEEEVVPPKMKDGAHPYVPFYAKK